MRQLIVKKLQDKGTKHQSYCPKFDFEFFDQQYVQNKFLLATFNVFLISSIINQIIGAIFGYKVLIQTSEANQKSIFNF